MTSPVIYNEEAALPTNMSEPTTTSSPLTLAASNTPIIDTSNDAPSSQLPQLGKRKPCRPPSMA